MLHLQNNTVEIYNTNLMDIIIQRQIETMADSVSSIFEVVHHCPHNHNRRNNHHKHNHSGNNGDVDPRPEQ